MHGPRSDCYFRPAYTPRPYEDQYGNRDLVLVVLGIVGWKREVDKRHVVVVVVVARSDQLSNEKSWR